MDDIMFRKLLAALRCGQEQRNISGLKRVVAKEMSVLNMDTIE